MDIKRSSRGPSRGPKNGNNNFKNSLLKLSDRHDKTFHIYNTTILIWCQGTSVERASRVVPRIKIAFQVVKSYIFYHILFIYIFDVIYCTRSLIYLSDPSPIIGNACHSLTDSLPNSLPFSKLDACK